MFIYLFFVKLLLDTRKVIIIIRKQKIIKRIIFALFLNIFYNISIVKKSEKVKINISLTQ